ncbi:MAG TPA: DUF1957 domain-containing protein [Tepiditoga sp.]|nr:DUF1957 domain-containing protein [Thermotogota bacterium]HOO73661.1 DUF1957 domain-containing protein [Tepiditoga sp.]
MKKGNFLLMLHAHLPYVRHPDYPDFLEERWLFEAITETYIPLIKMFRSLENENIKFKLAISITPTLSEMLSDEDLQNKYISHMNKLIELSEKEIIKTEKENVQKFKTAKFYNSHFKEILHIYSDLYSRNILKAFKEFQEKGYIEVVTCSGTHGFLPFMKNHPEAVRAQIKVGVETYKKNFGKSPNGIWLAECAYSRGFDRILKSEGINYFFTDSHALWYSETPAHYGVYYPVITPGGDFVFARDPESSEQVWSSVIGYPGDSRYREFYRDIGFDRDFEYIKDYIDKSGTRCNTGIKYYKITDKTLPAERKDFYDINEAYEVARNHAKDFVLKKEFQVKKLTNIFDDIIPLITAPFDAELYGHWWYEGPVFLESLFREIAKSEIIESVLPSEIINSLETVQVLEPADSTWGANGFNEVWLNEKNDWIYRHLNHIASQMHKKATEYKNPSELEKRVLNQMAREVLLSQASDWPFIMTTGTTVDYAVNRIDNHINRFFKLEKMLDSNKIDTEELSHIEWIDKIFNDIDFNIYS